jgi:hypothetical protein
MTQTELMQRDQVTNVLREALAGLIPDSTQFAVLSCQELKSATGRRRVIKYVVDGLDPTGPVALVAKIFTELHRAELLFDHLQALSDGPFAVGELHVPQPLAFLRSENLVLFRADTGVPLYQLGDNVASLAGVRDAARWLARLHSSRVQLPRSFDQAKEVASTHEWAAVVGRHRPEVLESAQWLASNWATFGGPAPAATYVPIHKDFHAGHVLVDHSVCVIDLDEARNGDRNFDLAHFCTYLEWQGGQSRVRREIFLQEYSSGTGWVDDGWYARYAAYTWLKIAKQLAVRSGPYQARDGTGGWEAGDAVARGIACLAR